MKNVDLECLEDYEDECEIHFSTPEEFANALKGRMKYIFVNQNGSYTIGYDDGYVFGGHEIDVDVDSKGKMVCADMRQITALAICTTIGFRK